MSDYQLLKNESAPSSHFLVIHNEIQTVTDSGERMAQWYRTGLRAG
jgi:hypothetical protein